MEYQVPQFIEVESKIVGPLTLKQFIYIAGTIGMCSICIFYLPLVFAILLILPIGGLGIALAFYKVNGKSFVEMLEAAFNYYTGAKFFLWKHIEPNMEITHTNTPATSAPTPTSTPKLTRGKLSELAWSLDVATGGAPAEEVPEPKGSATLNS